MYICFQGLLSKENVQLNLLHYEIKIRIAAVLNETKSLMASLPGILAAILFVLFCSSCMGSSTLLTICLDAMNVRSFRGNGSLKCCHLVAVMFPIVLCWFVYVGVVVLRIRAHLPAGATLWWLVDCDVPVSAQSYLMY